MKFWWFVFALGVLSIGCGGGVGNAGTTTTGGTTTTTGTANPVPAPAVVLSDNANMQFTVVTGQGRRALESHIVSIPNLSVRNDEFDFVGLSGSINATLESYSLASLSTAYTIPITLFYKHFSTMPLAITSFTIIDSGGAQSNWSGLLQPTPFDADVLLSRGRDTTLQFTMNDAIVSMVSLAIGPVFDRDQFILENYRPLSNKVESLFSDYVAFDISGLSGADRPNLKNGADAEKALFSGDAISVSAGFGSFGTMQILDPILDPTVTQDQGVINEPIIIGGIPTEGVYTLFEPDPRFIDPTDGIIVSLQGRWRPYTQVLTGLGQYAMIIFPSSRSFDTGGIDFSGNPIYDSEEFTAVYIARNTSGQITALWQGPARFTGPNANEIRLSRIRDVVSGLEVDPAVGTLSVPIFSRGIVTSGTFTFSSGSVPAEFTTRFPLTGSYRVFRK